jgi:ankyrin repeat protein
MTIKNWFSILLTIFTLTFNSLAYDEIHQAALDGNLDKVKVLLEANPSLISSKISTNDTYYARYGYTPLLCAAEQGRTNVVVFLLTHQADVNAKSDGGNSALQMAAYHGRKDVVEVLLSHKAEVNTKDLYGYTPLHDAAGAGHQVIVELLLVNKANVNAKSNNGETPLHLAILMKHNEVANLLRKNGGQE